jgi:hypothetical protein
MLLMPHEENASLEPRDSNARRVEFRDHESTGLSVTNYNTMLSSDSLETGTGKFEFTSLAVHRAESREIRAFARDLRLRMDPEDGPMERHLTMDDSSLRIGSWFTVIKRRSGRLRSDHIDDEACEHDEADCAREVGPI